LLLTAWLLPVEWLYWPRWERYPVFVRNISPWRNAFYRLEDPAVRLLGGYSVPDSLPVLRFSLPDSAENRLFAHLDTLLTRGINATASRTWVKADFQATTEGTDDPSSSPSLPVRLTWHGKFRNHWAFRQRSLKVKLGKGQSWWGLTTFSLITPDNRDGPGQALATHLATSAGVWHPRERLVRVTVNDRDWGLYYAEEPIDTDFLARRGMADGALLAPRATWADDFPDHRRDAPYGQGVGLNRASHVHGLSLEPAFQEVEATNDSIAAVALERWGRVRDLAYRVGPLLDAAADPATVPLPDSATVAALLDIPRWAAADALRHLLADRHNLAGDNLHVVYDPHSGRFFPLYRFEGGLVAIHAANGLTNGPTLTYNQAPLPLWCLVNRQPTLRAAKLRALHRLTASPQIVDAAVRAAASTTALVTRSPGAEQPIRARRWLAQKQQRALQANRALIHRSLTESTWLYATARYANGRLWLELLPEAEGALQLTGVLLRTAAGPAMFHLAKPADLLTRTGPLTMGGPEALLRTRDTLSLPWNGPRPLSVELTVQNALTGLPLPPERVRVAQLR
jgi:CotH kinase protein